MLPLGIEMLMAELGSTGVCDEVGMALCWKKCPVLPVSAMVDTVVVGIAGGPIESEESCCCCNGCLKAGLFLRMMLLTCCFFAIGSPPPHMIKGVMVIWDGVLC